VLIQCPRCPTTLHVSPSASNVYCPTCHHRIDQPCTCPRCAAGVNLEDASLIQLAEDKLQQALELISRVTVKHPRKTTLLVAVNYVGRARDRLGVVRREFRRTSPKDTLLT
jgi:primosomal protein N'